MQTSLELLANYVLPEGILAYFDIKHITEQKGQLSITLSEKNSPPEQQGQQLPSKGFYPTVRIIDFPIRNRSVRLLVRKRKWKDLDSGKVVKTDWSSLRSKGSSYTAQFSAFLKKWIDNYAVSANNVAKYYGLSGSQLQQKYKHHLIDYEQWHQLSHAKDWILYPENMRSKLCIDEVALSKCELYTIISNPSARTQKGSLVAMVKGTKSEQVCKVLRKIPMKTRQSVEQVCIDLAASMQLIAINLPVK